jgi:excisionase family DNA binding protein
MTGETVRGFTEDESGRTAANMGTIGVMLKHPKEGITIPDAAKRIGVDEQTLRNWIRTGKLPATRWGPEGAKVIRIDPGDLADIGARPAGPTSLVLHCHRERETANMVEFAENRDDDQTPAGLRLPRTAVEQLGDPTDLTITIRAGAPPQRGRPRKQRKTTTTTQER